jgi:putative addiction module component (TIGR02574 family)
MRVKDIPHIDKLSIPEKILLVEELWDTIGSTGVDVLVPQSHKSELDNRLASLNSYAGKLLSLDELRERIESRK